MRVTFRNTAECISSLWAVMADAKSSSLAHEFHAVSLSIAQSRRQRLLLCDYGSETTKHIVGNSDLMAHCFTDYLKKRTCLLEIANTRHTQILLKDICVYMDWTVQNYAMIMGHTPHVATLVGQLREDMLPCLKNHLQNACGLSTDAMEAGLINHAAMLEKTKAAGMEILLPIPAEKWQKASCTLQSSP